MESLLTLLPSHGSAGGRRPFPGESVETCSGFQASSEEKRPSFLHVPHRKFSLWGLPRTSVPGRAGPCPQEAAGKVLTLVLILEQLLGAEFEDVIQLLLGHGARLGAQPGPDHQVCQHHLPLGHLCDPLFHGRASHKPVNHHLVGLADAMSAAEGLRGQEEEVGMGQGSSLETGPTCWGEDAGKEGSSAPGKP